VTALTTTWKQILCGQCSIGLGKFRSGQALAEQASDSSAHVAIGQESVLVPPGDTILFITLLTQECLFLLAYPLFIFIIGTYLCVVFLWLGQNKNEPALPVVVLFGTPCAPKYTAISPLLL